MLLPSLATSKPFVVSFSHHFRCRSHTSNHCAVLALAGLTFPEPNHNGSRDLDDLGGRHNFFQTRDLRVQLILPEVTLEVFLWAFPEIVDLQAVVSLANSVPHFIELWRYSLRVRLFCILKVAILSRCKL